MTLALVIFGFLAVNPAQATDWTVSQLTNNSYIDQFPQIYGSNVVWRGEGDIFLYDSNSITIISDSGGRGPQIDGSNVVWYGDSPGSWTDEIFLYDGSSTTQLTHDDMYATVLRSTNPT